MIYKYEGIFHEAIFLSRPNRFLAEVDLEGEIVLAHVKNTGRMREILRPGTTCYIMEAKNPARKTKYDLISIFFQGAYINLDSQVPNIVVAEAFKNSEIRGYEDPDEVKREVSVGESRLDMRVSKGSRDLYVEVKGVDLIESGHAKFPDAITARGTKHLLSLENLVREGKEAMVVFLVQRNDALDFRPNYEMDPVFAQTLYRVKEAGVMIRVYLSQVGKDFIGLGKEIPLLDKVF